MPTLKRHLQTLTGTYGELSVNGEFWPTVERPADDPAGHPCIPAGTYAMHLGTHHEGQPDAYPCYWIDGVPGRSAIEIHAANTPDELLGCIAPGMTLAWFAGVLGVARSRAALAEFMDAMQRADLQLIVIDP